MGMFIPIFNIFRHIFMYIYTYFHVYFYLFLHIYHKSVAFYHSLAQKVWYYCTTIVCCFTKVLHIFTYIYLDYSAQSTYFYLHLPIFTTYFYLFSCIFLYIFMYISTYFYI